MADARKVEVGTGDQIAAAGHVFQDFHPRRAGPAWSSSSSQVISGRPNWTNGACTISPRNSRRPALLRNSYIVWPAECPAALTARFLHRFGQQAHRWSPGVGRAGIDQDQPGFSITT
jgi:hypothetical protein